MKVAFLTAACILPGHPQRRADYWEHDREFAALHAACAQRGIDLRAVVWDDPTLDADAYDAFVIGTTWDYTHRPDVFVRTLERYAERRPVFNPLDVVRWNLTKTYLRDLESRGAPVVPTVWVDRADETTVGAAFDSLEVDEVVVKPTVGAGAWRQALVRRGGPLPPADALPPAAAMVQPLLPSAQSEGEYSFLFFDGEYSHCVRKTPAPGEYRVQSIFGGREQAHAPSSDDLALTQRVVDALDTPPLYARVDMIRIPAGSLVVMELELIEPYLYPEQGPGMGEAFAAALARRMALLRGR